PAAPEPRPGLLARAAECWRERRLPYAVRRALTAPAAAPVHRAVLNALLRAGAGRRPEPLSYAEVEALHQRYPVRDGYKYDLAAKEERATHRLAELGQLVDLSRVRDAAEVGAGDGRLSLHLLRRGVRPRVLDI